MRFLLRLIINAAAILAVAYYLPGIHVSSILSALIMAVILAVINAIIRPLIILLTLPINILTLGLFTLVINAVLFWFASAFVVGVEVDTYASAFWAALIVSIVSWVASQILKKEKRD